MNCPICEEPLTGEKDITGFQYCAVCRIGRREEIDVPQRDYNNTWVKEHNNPETARRMKWHVNKIRKVIKTGKTLDIGCGSGVLVDILSRKYDAWGTDVSQSVIDYCKEYRHGVYRTMQNLGDDYDLITALQVFEHLPNPEVMMDFIKGILKPNGYLYIEVPNTDQPLAYSAQGTDHRICYTIQSLTEYLKLHGFKIRYVRTLTLSENIAVNVIGNCNKASKIIKVSGNKQKILNYVVKQIRESWLINLLTLPRRIIIDRKQQGYNIVCLAQLEKIY